MEVASAAQDSPDAAEVVGATAPQRSTIYFLAKKLWAKGYRELLDLLQSPEMAKARADGSLELNPVRLYGSGPDEQDIDSEVQRLSLEDLVELHPAIDHADPHLNGYDIFVNPSVSEVLCTATAEAIAMGKIVLIAKHPSNEFFEQFSNCHTFSDAADFVAQLQRLQYASPLPLRDQEVFALSWRAATERLVDAVAPFEGTRGTDRWRSRMAYSLQKCFHIGLLGEFLKSASGALPDIPWDLRFPALAALIMDEKDDASSKSRERGPEQGTSSPGLASSEGWGSLVPAALSVPVAAAVLWLPATVPSGLDETVAASSSTPALPGPSPAISSPSVPTSPASPAELLRLPGLAELPRTNLLARFQPRLKSLADTLDLPSASAFSTPDFMRVRQLPERFSIPDRLLPNLQELRDARRDLKLPGAGRAGLWGSLTTGDEAAEFET